MPGSDKTSLASQTYTKRPLCDQYCPPNKAMCSPASPLVTFSPLVSSSKYSAKTLSHVVCMEGAQGGLYDNIHYEMVEICPP